jgi:hypothetical protein
VNVQELGRRTLESCRSRGWAAMETGISRPVPEVAAGRVRLWYLLYRSQVKPPHQMLYEPFARVVVDYASGDIVEHQELTTATPPRLMGRYPHAAAAHVPREQWQAVWDELFGLYPDVIAAFSGQPAPGQRDKVLRFAELLDLTTPPFLLPSYRALNPAFFDWLARARPAV